MNITIVIIIAVAASLVATIFDMLIINIRCHTCPVITVMVTKFILFSFPKKLPLAVYIVEREKTFY